MFDARSAKLLPAGAHLTFPGHPGLRLEATKTKKNWVYRYRTPEGRLRQLKLGEWPALSYNRAVVLWEDCRNRRAAGEDPAGEASRKAPEKVQKSLTVMELCMAYWRDRIQGVRAQKGVTEVRRLFEKELGDLGNRPVESVRRSDAYTLIRELAERKPVIAGQVRQELGAAWEYGYDSGQVTEEVYNWWRTILRGKIRSKGKKIAGKHIGLTKRVLSDSEVGTLIRWLPNLSRSLEDVLTLYLWTTCRGAEIVAAEGREIILEGDQYWWVIPKARTKNRWRDTATDLRVPLFGRARQILLRRREIHGEGYLFPSRNGKVPHIEQKSIQSSLFVYQPYSQVRAHKITKRLPVTHFAPHDLRRTSKTMLAAMGCPGEVAEAILGHVPPRIVGIYNRHTYDREKVEWLKKLSDRLESLAQEVTPV